MHLVPFLIFEPSLHLPVTLKVEQGHEMNKEGLVYVHVEEIVQEISISISGTAVFVKAIELTL